MINRVERAADGAPGQVFVFSGPSGVGKGTIIAGVLERLDDVVLSVSATTRPPRSGETDGVHYHFVSDADFESMIQRDELLEWADVFGRKYGTPRAEVEKAVSLGTDVILEIDVQGAAAVRAKMPEAVSIFVQPPDVTSLEKRLRGRGTDDDETVQRRIRESESEMAEAARFEHRIVNDSLDDAVDQVVDIIKGHRKGRLT